MATDKVRIGWNGAVNATGEGGRAELHAMEMLTRRESLLETQGSVQAAQESCAQTFRSASKWL